MALEKKKRLEALEVTGQLRKPSSTPVNSVDWAQAREDVRRFVKATEYPSLELWSRELFLSQLQKVKG